jgi:ABC-type transport system involved in cytochrome c biogenesis ATPase subunit
MLLKKFSVSGFKNLTQPIELDELGQINVIHGANNVGKSNLLQAMDLYFRVNEYISQSGHNVFNKETEDAFNKYFGYPIFEIFNLTTYTTIDIGGVIIINPTIEDIITGYQIILEPERQARIGISLPVALLLQWHQAFHLKSNPLNKEQKFTNPFALITTHRRTLTDTTPPSLTIIPQTLRDALFDAKESREAFWVQRWNLFVEAMTEFEDIIGPGRFNTAFDRARNQADLVLDRGDVRIPVDLLGSGIQQIVALLGQLLLTPADIVAIEEPELNLRYTLQTRLLQAFKKITQSEHGPQQLFLTSHSPAFEAEPYFFAMELKEGVPVISRKSCDLAWKYTGQGQSEADSLHEMYAKWPEPVNYVSSEGLLLLPEIIRNKLSLQQGGGVSFMPNKNTGRFELWTMEELDKWFSGEGHNASTNG